MNKKDYKEQYYHTHRNKWEMWYQTNRETILKKAVARRQANPEQYLLNECRHRAKTKGLDFNLEISDIVIPEYCPYLEVKLELKLGQGKRTWTNPSVDRIDSTKGYVKGNVQVISGRANRLKGDASINELVTFAKNILKNKA